LHSPKIPPLLSVKKPRQAVVFFTHLFDALVEQRYRKLKAGLCDHADVFILAQAGTLIAGEFLDETHFFEYDRLRSRVVGVGTAFFRAMSTLLRSISSAKNPASIFTGSLNTTSFSTGTGTS
jgi:hypothetical protein